MECSICELGVVFLQTKAVIISFASLLWFIDGLFNVSSSNLMIFGSHGLFCCFRLMFFSQTKAVIISFASLLWCIDELFNISLSNLMIFYLCDEFVVALFLYIYLSFAILAVNRE